jgi:hypothetical protein
VSPSVALDEAPQLKRYLILNGLSALTFWVSVWAGGLGLNLMIETVMKFIGYLSVFVWLDSALYLRGCALGLIVESWEFQRERVKLSLFVVLILIVAELPVWITSLSRP